MRHKGNLRAQRHRRSQRRKLFTKPPKQQDLYPCIDGNMTYRPAAYCKYYRAYLTGSMMVIHRCKNRKCKQLQDLEYDEDQKVVK